MMCHQMQNFLVRFYTDHKNPTRATHEVLVKSENSNGVFEKARKYFGLDIDSNCTRIEYGQSRKRGIQLI